MNRIAVAWRWARTQVRDHRTQLRLCLRVTVAAMLSFVLAAQPSSLGAGPPSTGGLDAAFDRYDAEIAALRREGLARDLSADAVERLFALGFALDQLRRNFADLDRCVGEFAQAGAGAG